MSKAKLEKLNTFVNQFYQLLNENDFIEAKKLLDAYVKETGDSLNIAGCKIDLGTHSSTKTYIEDGISTYKKALEKDTMLQIEHKQSFNYNIGNGYMSLYSISKATKGTNYRAFKDNQELLEAAKYFKESMNLGNREPSIFTNYGNLLDIQGRYLEAINFYNKAIKANQQWGMAYGNKAISVISLAQISGKYQTAQYIYAYQLLKKAFEFQDNVIQIGGTQALAEFSKRMIEIEKLFEDKSDLLNNDLPHSKFKTDKLNEQLRRFYDFSIDNDLFLNLHIQDKTCEAATTDHVFISLITEIDDNDSFYKFAGWINEMKESYLTARYLLTESDYKTTIKTQISTLTDIVYPLDYSTKNLYTGLIKASIKESFSILDKIGYFLNEYMTLEIKNEEAINWKNVWFRDLKANNPKHWFEDECTFHHKIKESNNYTLFGLFSLFLDINDSELPNLRHQLTHRKILVKLEGSGNGKDEFTLDDLTDSAIKLLSFTKSAIIYLVNYVNSQENRKRSKGLVAPMFVITDQFIY
jgi:tetratricopeptide (TPR) repeat protein